MTLIVDDAFKTYALRVAFVRPDGSQAAKTWAYVAASGTEARREAESEAQSRRNVGCTVVSVEIEAA